MRNVLNLHPSSESHSVIANTGKKRWVVGGRTGSGDYEYLRSFRTKKEADEQAKEYRKLMRAGKMGMITKIGVD